MSSYGPGVSAYLVAASNKKWPTRFSNWRSMASDKWSYSPGTYGNNNRPSVG